MRAFYAGVATLCTAGAVAGAATADSFLGGVAVGILLTLAVSSWLLLFDDVPTTLQKSAKTLAARRRRRRSANIPNGFGRAIKR